MKLSVSSCFVIFVRHHLIWLGDSCLSMPTHLSTVVCIYACVCIWKTARKCVSVSSRGDSLSKMLTMQSEKKSQYISSLETHLTWGKNKGPASVSSPPPASLIIYGAYAVKHWINTKSSWKISQYVGVQCLVNIFLPWYRNWAAIPSVVNMERDKASHSFPKDLRRSIRSVSQKYSSYYKNGVLQAIRHAMPICCYYTLLH